MALLAAVVACLSLTGATKAEAASQEAYPSYAAVLGGGANVTTSQVQSDAAASQPTVIAGQNLNVEGGLWTTSTAPQTVTANFQIECYTSSGQAVDVYTPSVQVTVPGNPTFNTNVMAKVEGTITLPATCAHQASNSEDGFLALTVTQNGMSAAQDTFLTIGSQLPGPGLPAAGAVGAVTLWRAVDQTELSALKANANRYAIPAGGTEGKYFYPTEAQAQNLANLYQQQGYGQYTVTSTTIDESTLRANADSISISGEGDAYYLFQDAVDALEAATIVE